MTRFHAATATRSALMAIAAIGTLSAIGASAAEARHGHHARVVVHLGHGIGVGLHHHSHRSALIVSGGGHRCGYLYRRAIRTGAAYWWDRYEDCRAGY